MDFDNMDRVRIKKGWDKEGRQGTVLGKAVFLEQNWTPVHWDDESDPNFIKTAAIELLPVPDPQKGFKYFRVECFSGWFIVMAKNEKKAKSAGVQEFGRGNVHKVNEATPEDVIYYLNLKGQIGKFE